MPFKYIGTGTVRGDAYDKVIGATKYMSDLKMDQMLWGATLRAQFPHAFIKNIDYSKAASIPGVVAILTYQEIPGINAFGIVIQDQPVCVKTR